MRIKIQILAWNLAGFELIPHNTDIKIIIKSSIRRPVGLLRAHQAINPGCTPGVRWCTPGWRGPRTAGGLSAQSAECLGL
jgi:hypothetical protein